MKKKFENPVVFPFGHSLCLKHVIEKEDSGNEKIKCKKCDIEHFIPVKGFPQNKDFDAFLEYNFDYGPEYKVTMENLENLRELFEEFKRINDTPELELDRMVSELRNKIDLRREEVKKNADEQAFKLYDELDVYEEKYKNKRSLLDIPNDESSIEIKNLVDSLETDLVLWKNEMNKRDVKKFKSIQKETISKYEKLREETERQKETVFPDGLQKIKIDYLQFFEDISHEPLM